MIQLRDGAATDAERLFELDRICFDDGIAYSLREFHRLLRSPKTICILAENDEHLTGFVIAQHVVRPRSGGSGRSTGGHIITIDVAPDFRRHGIGRLLTEQIEARLRVADVSWLRLEVAVNNPAASKFYASLGFVPTGRISNYYNGSIDAVAMEKAFDSGR